MSTGFGFRFVIDVRDGQYEKTHSSIIDTLSGMTTDLGPPHP